MHLRRAAVAAGVALLVAVSPISAAGPATGQWSAVGPAVYPTFKSWPSGEWVYNTRVGPDGRLYAVGKFTDASGDPTADNLAVYDPITGAWAGIGSDGAGSGALNGMVYDVAWLNGTLYAAGSFTAAGGVTGASYLAAWNGTSWSYRGGPNAFNEMVTTLAVQNGYLYAGGAFTDAGGDATADNVAVFNGYAWHGLAGAGALDGAISNAVMALQVLPNGRVYIGGAFTNVTGLGAKGNRVAYWDPALQSWNALGGPGAMDNAIGATVFSLAVSGSRVYVAGSFDNAGGVPQADRVAMWDGAAWRSLGASANGTDGAVDGGTVGLALYGTNVIVAAQFNSVDTVAAWTGSKWIQLGLTGTEAPANKVTVSGRTLYVAGGFNGVNGVALTADLAAFGLPDAPSVPRALKATAGAKKVTLAWTAPATTNGAALTDYVIQYRKVGAVAWTTFADGVKTARTAVVTGLKTGTSYQFQVLAKNDWGTGYPSLVVVKKAL